MSGRDKYWLVGGKMGSQTARGGEEFCTFWGYLTIF